MKRHLKRSRNSHPLWWQTFALISSSILQTLVHGVVYCRAVVGLQGFWSDLRRLRGSLFQTLINDSCLQRLRFFLLIFSLFTWLQFFWQDFKHSGRLETYWHRLMRLRENTAYSAKYPSKKIYWLTENKGNY